MDDYAKGLDDAYGVYTGDMGYAPGWTGLIPVEIHNFPPGDGAGQVLPEISNLYGWALPGSANTIELSPVTQHPFYLAHHETFHVFQYHFVSAATLLWLGQGITNPAYWPEAIDRASSVRWLSESTAEWAAEEVTRHGVADDADFYPHNLQTFLGTPEEALDAFDGGNAGRQYGSFVFDEYGSARSA